MLLFVVVFVQSIPKFVSKVKKKKFFVFKKNPDSTLENLLDTMNF